VAWTAHVLPVVTLAVLATALYWPSLRGPFVYDDPNAISQSQLIRSLTPLTRFVTLSTRPLTDFSFAISYAISGLSPWSYHAINLFLHALNGLLLYAIALRTLALPSLSARYGGVRLGIAWAAAALFVAHPLMSESVAYVSSRSEVLASTFYLLTLGSFIVAATTENTTVRRAHAFLVPMWAAAGLGSKEIAATAPAALLLYDWLFLADGDWRRTRRHWWLIGLAALPLVAGGIFLFVRAQGSGSALGKYGATAGLGFDRFSGAEYLMTQFGVILYYFRLVLVPVGQTFDYDWPIARSPLAPAVIVPLLLLAAIVWLAWYWRRTQPVYTFAIAWTLLVLAPTSSVLPIADLAVERRMYLPMAALMLLAAAWLFDAASLVAQRVRAAPRWAFVFLATVVLAPLAMLTYVRAELWGDAIALHEDGVAKAPNNPRVRLNLGVTYLNLRQRDKALEVLREAKVLYDRQESVHAFPRIGAFIHYNLGAVLYTKGDHPNAAIQLRRALEIGGQYLALRPMAYMLLARIEAAKRNWKAAAANFQEALRYQENLDWRYDQIEMYRQAGDFKAAFAAINQISRRYPNDPNLARVHAEVLAASRKMQAATGQMSAPKKP
jgi:tetratricopeptide (TPR) repeat protein